MSHETEETVSYLPESHIKNEQALFFAGRLRRYQQLMSLPFLFPHEAQLIRCLGKSTYWDLVWSGYQHLAEEILCNPIAENSTLETQQ